MLWYFAVMLDVGPLGIVLGRRVYLIEQTRRETVVERTGSPSTVPMILEHET